MRSNYCLTQKSDGRNSIAEKQTVISKGVRVTRQQEDRRLKISKKPNFDYLKKAEERKMEEN